jgi:hypothetical protein
MDGKKQRKYCGKKEELPIGYDRPGTRYECLRKGIGVGLNMDRERKNRGAAVQIITDNVLMGVATNLGIARADTYTRSNLISRMESILKNQYPS